MAESTDHPQNVTVNRRLPPPVEELLRKALLEAVSALHGFRRQLTNRERFVYTAILHQPVRNERLSFDAQRVPPLDRLLPTAEFQSLLRFSIEEPTIRELFLAAGNSVLLERPESSKPAREYYERTLLRICAYLEELGPSHLDDFIHFLNLDAVERIVAVPLLNVDLVADEIAIFQFGQLRKFGRGSSAPWVELSFPIHTPHFAAATLSPVWEEIKKRVSLVGLAAHPLAAYNHFRVEFFLPWEEFFPDTQFATRFWSSNSDENPVPVAEITFEHAQQIESLSRQVLASPQWNQVTSWRVACDRLDDAVFKLECRSPDSILDIVIGLESLLAEADSRQESTHKVAVRAARYLEEDLTARKEVFRLVKQAYRARSTLAHGQTWTLDAEGLTQLVRAAKLLARILGRMALDGKTSLDHSTLDLA